ncbi:hypothetical protein P5673_022976 [Acropora cervicornis]|uniref:Uncharacterized protein n=1 Tax=Acropora cervicornis TaxID=6130 RepID=A0AAD9Q5Y5_ACRCE|nr:hypothetical protein P5673_022976 [Acropora cervicornis]
MDAVMLQGLLLKKRAINSPLKSKKKQNHVFDDENLRFQTPVVYRCRFSHHLPGNLKELYHGGPQNLGHQGIFFATYCTSYDVTKNQGLLFWNLLVPVLADYHLCWFTIKYALRLELNI